MNKLPTAFWISGIVIAALLPANAAIHSLDQQRQTFIEAQQQLKSKQMRAFKQSLAALDDYPIQPYLQKDELLQRFSSSSDDEILAFIERYADYPFASHLRGKLLKRLAQQQQWSKYLRVYDQRNDTTARCHYLTALIRSNQHSDILSKIEPLWLRGTSQPDACDPAFQYLSEHHPDYQELIWQRLELALKARRPKLASYLSRQLQNPAAQKLASDWVYAHRRPEKALQHLKQRQDSPRMRKILLHAVERLARRDADKARQQWQELEQHFSFSTEQQQNIALRLALASAYQHLDDAYTQISAIPASLKNDNAFLWQARMALRQQQWQALADTIEQMPARLAQENEWQYWRARALKQLGNNAEAHAIFSLLAQKNTYYGFLAADAIDQDYRIQSLSTAAQDDAQQLLQSHPELLRARELYHVDRVVEARREWFAGLRGLSKAQIKQAAKLADNWNWHDNAIRTAYQGEDFSNYQLRFPTPYRQKVLKLAQQYDLDPALVYGVIRRESAFDPMARSHVGALGLMQLMPSTAKHMARSLGLKKPGKYAILDIDQNLLMGTHYLSRLLQRYDQNIPLAVAAYNAGPSRVKRWLPEQAAEGDSGLDPRIWIESVPFRETRNYVQAVLAYANIFDPKLGQKKRLSDRMQPVKASYIR